MAWWGLSQHPEVAELKTCAAADQYAAETPNVRPPTHRASLTQPERSMLKEMSYSSLGICRQHAGTCKSPNHLTLTLPNWRLMKLSLKKIIISNLTLELLTWYKNITLTLVFTKTREFNQAICHSPPRIKPSRNVAFPLKECSRWLETKGFLSHEA